MLIFFVCVCVEKLHKYEAKKHSFNLFTKSTDRATEKGQEPEQEEGYGAFACA